MPTDRDNTGSVKVEYDPPKIDNASMEKQYEEYQAKLEKKGLTTKPIEDVEPPKPKDY